MAHRSGDQGIDCQRDETISRAKSTQVRLSFCGPKQPYRVDKNSGLDHWIDHRRCWDCSGTKALITNPYLEAADWAVSAVEAFPAQIQVVGG